MIRGRRSRSNSLSGKEFEKFGSRDRDLRWNQDSESEYAIEITNFGIEITELGILDWVSGSGLSPEFEVEKFGIRDQNFNDNVCWD